MGLLYVSVLGYKAYLEELHDMRENVCRNEKVDMLRGIAIILVMLGHGLDLVMKNGMASSSAGGGYTLTYDVIYMFHMPLFFMISGYVYKSNNEKVLRIVMKNIISFYVPYLFLNYLYWAERLIASGIFGLQLARDDYPSGIRLLWMGDSLTWFLLSMMLVKIVFNILDTYTSDVLTVSVFSLLFWLSCIFPQYKLFYYLQWGIFFCVGYVIHRYSIDRKWVNIIYIVCVNLFLIGVDHYILLGLDKFVKIFVGISVFIIYMCFKNIPHSGFMALCGRNSIVIYIIHGLSQYVCYYVIVEVFHINASIIVLCLIIILQLLSAFSVIGLFTKVKYLQWMKIIFYPYKYLSEKKEGKKKMERK